MSLPAVRAAQTAGALITETLRNDILTGRLSADEPLLLDRLAERFGTSVIPIREALRVLAAERLVVLRPHRTAQVASLSLGELLDLYRVRLLLDVEAVRLAQPNLTSKHLAEMSALVDAMDRSVVRGRDLEAFAVHAKVHFRIYERAGSPILLGMLETLWDETERYRHAVKHHRNYGQTWVQEHRHLIDLLAQGDGDRSAAEMKAHIQRTVDALATARSLEGVTSDEVSDNHGQRRRVLRSHDHHPG